MSPWNAVPGVTAQRAVTRACGVCGAAFTVVTVPSLAEPYTCCGPECRKNKRCAALAKAREARPGKAITTKVCIICRQPFTVIGKPSKAAVTVTCRGAACQSAHRAEIGRRGGLRSVAMRAARRAKETVPCN